LVNAGVTFASMGTGTGLVSIGLICGKPLGITLFTLVGVKFLGLELSKGMTMRHIISLGMVAGIGFTVALFVATAAYPTPGPIQESVKMGALLSFLSAPIGFVGARLLGVRPEATSTFEDDAEQLAAPISQNT